MSPQERTTRPPRARVRTWCARTALVALVAGTAPATVPGTLSAGSLSEAAKEALKPVEKQHPVQVPAPSPPPAVVATTLVICSPPSPLPQPLPPYPGPEPSYDPHQYLPEFQAWKRRPDLHVGPVVAVSELSSSDFSTATFAGIRMGTSRGGRSVFDIAFLGGPARFTPGSDLSRALQHAREMAIEGSFRFSLTPPHSPFGIGPVVGFRAGHLTWRYLNPIQLETPELIWTVSDDAIWHYSPYLGIATTFVNTRHVDLGITALTGVRYYATESREGLTNDLFPDTQFRELRFEARVVF